MIIYLSLVFSLFFGQTNSNIGDEYDTIINFLTLENINEENFSDSKVFNNFFNEIIEIHKILEKNNFDIENIIEQIRFKLSNYSLKKTNEGKKVNYYLDSKENKYYLAKSAIENYFNNRKKVNSYINFIKFDNDKNNTPVPYMIIHKYRERKPLELKRHEVDYTNENYETATTYENFNLTIDLANNLTKRFNDISNFFITSDLFYTNKLSVQIVSRSFFIIELLYFINNEIIKNELFNNITENALSYTCLRLSNINNVKKLDQKESFDNLNQEEKIKINTALLYIDIYKLIAKPMYKYIEVNY